MPQGMRTRTALQAPERRYRLVDKPDDDGLLPYRAMLALIDSPGCDSGRASMQ
jgi:hypothetical protein